MSRRLTAPRNDTTKHTSQTMRFNEAPVVDSRFRPSGHAAMYAAAQKFACRREQIAAQRTAPGPTDIPLHPNGRC
jgi:hypothetical protein